MVVRGRGHGAVVVQGVAARRRTAVRRALWYGAEAAVTLGVVLLLLVVHQLWWTNQQARAGAQRQVRALEEEWGVEGERSGAGASDVPADSVVPDGDGGNEGAEESSSDAESRPASAPRWDQAYAVLSIPRLGVRVPVAEGVSKDGVLNKGYAGHYPQTAQPGRAGNFAVAGHRNTHGEPFRYINRLSAGDQLKVVTKSAEYAYVVDRVLPQTLPRDTGVIAPVPRSDVKTGYGYGKPGYYITLTTCTPEYTSTYRLIVWGKLTSVRPR